MVALVQSLVAMPNNSPQTPQPDPDDQSVRLHDREFLDKPRDPFAREVVMEPANQSNKGFTAIKQHPAEKAVEEPVVAKEIPVAEKPIVSMAFSKTDAAKAPIKLNSGFQRLTPDEAAKLAEKPITALDAFREIRPEDIRVKERTSGFNKKTTGEPDQIPKHHFRKTTLAPSDESIEDLQDRKSIEAKMEAVNRAALIQSKRQHEPKDYLSEDEPEVEKIPTSPREKLLIVASLSAVAILLVIGYIAVHRLYFKPIAYPEFVKMPILTNGSVIENYQTFWKKPTPEQNVRINTTIIPHVVLKTSKASCSYRVLFYDDAGKSVGDPMTLTSSNGTLDFFCTSGFSTRQIFFGYQVGSFKPWKFEVWQAPNIDSEVSAYKKIFQSIISTQFKE